MKRTSIFIYIIFAVLFPLWVQAGDGYGHPAVSYVRADSVSLEDVFFSRLLSEYFNGDSSMRAKPVTLTAKERQTLVDDSAEWQKDVAENMTLWGDTPSRNATENFYTAARMFLVNPSHKYADILERTLYNGVLAGLAPLNDDDSRRRAAQAVLDAVGMTYATSGYDVYVNLYYRNRAYVRSDSVDMVIMQNTSSPWKADVFFAMKFGSGSQYMRLHLRLPAWLRGEVMPGDKYRFVRMREFYQVFVNGELSLARAENGYIVLDRMWKSDDVVRLAMATPVRRIRGGAEYKGRFALQHGPIIYAYCGNDSNTFFRPGNPVGTLYDNEVLHTNMLIAKVYSSAAPDSELPWDCNLYPYYMLQSLKGPVRRVWLNEAK